MAAAVKKPVKRRDPSSPNTALVIFLVFFALASIGLGVWGYYGYAGQDKLKKDRETAVKEKDNSKIPQEFYRLGLLECRLALEPEKLEADDKSNLDIYRKKLAEEGFKDMPKEELEALKNLVDKNKEMLGWNNANGAFEKSYPQKLVEPQQDNKRLEALLAAKEQSIADLTKKLAAKSFTELKDIREKLEAQIAANHKIALEEAKKPPKALNDALDALRTAGEKHVEELDKKQKQIDSLEALKTKAETERDEFKKQLQKDPTIAAIEAAQKAGNVGGKAHGLALDLSTGKPFWDLPVGKIVGVDLKDRRIVVNLGHKDKVRPELTFTVFASGITGKADGYMKGTIEIQKILGAHTSEAVITSMYDIEGREIPINDSGRTRVQREASNPMKEGDLLFNVAWGSHVVVAGPVNWTGIRRNNPADQMRQLDEFKSILERQAITVDAYIDLNDGLAKGTATNQTRFMIKGDFLPPDLPEGKSSDRVKAVNLSIIDEETKAIAKGMFIVSSSNFAMLIGYRSPRSADDISVSTFQPRAPYSGSDFLELLRKKDKANDKKEKMEKKAEDGK